MGICFGKGEGRRSLYSPNYGTDRRNLARLPSTGGAQPGESSGKLIVLNDPTTGHGIEQKYELGEELGRGAFGFTYMCIDKVSRERFACKVISKRRLSGDVVGDVRREVEIMRHLPQHPNIISLKETYEDDDAVYLVMELCEGGELFHSISSRGRYTEREAAAAIRAIVEVVEVCHKYGVMHRDLKPENFLYANNNEGAPLKVIDFGISVFFKPGEIFNEKIGTTYTIAPDVLNRKYGPEADIWSAGVILYVLLSGFYPWRSDLYYRLLEEIHVSVIDFSMDPWPRVSDNAKDLVQRMLNRNSRTRLTAMEVLEHPWLQNASMAPNVTLGEEVKARLRQFSAMNKLKKQALRVIADYLPEEDVEESKERFKSMDVSNRGKINSDELRAGLQNLGYHVPDADLQTVMEAADDNKDGYLDYEEFVAARVHLKKLGFDEHLRKAFEFFDLNKNGYIEIEELRHALANEVDANGEEVIKAIMHDVDIDKDGKISYEDFAAIMNAGTDWRKVSKRYSQERFSSLIMNLEEGESSQVKKE